MADSDKFLTDAFMEKWDNIFKTVDIVNVPLQYIRCLVITLHDGEEYILDIKELLDQGLDVAALEYAIEEKLEEVDPQSIEYLLDIEKVSSEVQVHTDKALKDL